MLRVVCVCVCVCTQRNYDVLSLHTSCPWIQHGWMCAFGILTFALTATTLWYRTECGFKWIVDTTTITQPNVCERLSLVCSRFLNVNRLFQLYCYVSDWNETNGMPWKFQNIQRFWHLFYRIFASELHLRDTLSWITDPKKKIPKEFETVFLSQFLASNTFVHS